MKNKLKTIINELKKKFGNDIILTGKELSTLKIDRIPTGSIWLDYILEGGLPRGRMVEIYGVPATGKSLLALRTITQAQKRGLDCILIDAENAYDSDFSRKLGVDTDKLTVVKMSEAEKAFDIVAKLLEAKPAIIVIDSVASLVPFFEIDNETDKNTMALQARIMSKGCVSEDMRIFLPETGQYKRIADINVGDKVYSFDGNEIVIQSVTDKIQQGKKMIYQINDIELTDDHPILTIYGYKEIRDLTKNDVLIKKGAYKKFGDTKVSYNLAKIIGYLLGDGSITRKHGVGEFINTDNDIVADFGGLIAKFDCVLNQREPNKYRVSKNKHLPLGSFRNPLKQALDEVGLKKSTCYNKTIPASIFMSSRSAVRGVIEGLFNTDGYVSKQGILGFASTSEVMVIQVKELLNKFGIIGTVKQRESSSKFGKYWTLRITGKDNLSEFYSNFSIIARKNNVISSVLKNHKNCSCSRNSWLPSKYIQLIKRVFPVGTRVSRLLGFNSRTSYPEWNKPGRVKLSKTHVKRLLDGYDGDMDTDDMKNLTRNDVWYEPVKTIRKIGIKNVYDLSMSGFPNFVVNDYIVHNCRKITGLVGKANTLVIFINQLREKIGSYIPTEVTSGGRALGFYASIRIEVRRGEWITLKDMGKGSTQDEKKQRVGQVVKFNVTKSKVSKPHQLGSFRFFFNGVIDEADEIIALLEYTKKIQRKGAYYIVGKDKFQGRANFRKAVRKDPKLKDKLTNLLKEIGGK